MKYSKVAGLLLSLALAFVMSGLVLDAQRVQGQDDNLVQQGEYIANIARCISCHTPTKAEYQAEELSEELTRNIALFPRDTLDQTMWMAGGTVFSFGPAGSVTAPNITPDETTGIGRYTDEQLKETLLTGVTPEGRRMHGIMPTLNAMADSDVDAVIAYLRSLAPLENEVTNDMEVTTPAATPSEEPIIAPDPSEQGDRGAYLVKIMNCSGCHTPTDPETRRPIEDKFLAGRDPFQRDYGTVYAGNITPHEETGIGKWSDEAIARAISGGVRIDGRRLSLMPWQDYSALNTADVDAVVHYLTNDVTAVENTIPQTDLQEPYRVFESVEEVTTAKKDDPSVIAYLVTIIAVIGILVLGFTLNRRQTTT